MSKLAVRRSFFKKLSPDQIMRWSPDMISDPILKLGDDLDTVATQIYKNLLSYMGDRKSGKNPLDHVKKSIKVSMNATEDIKDEAYIQVLKQIKDHQD